MFFIYLSLGIKKRTNFEPYICYVYCKWRWHGRFAPRYKWRYVTGGATLQVAVCLTGAYAENIWDVIFTVAEGSEMQVYIAIPTFYKFVTI